MALTGEPFLAEVVDSSEAGTFGKDGVPSGKRDKACTVFVGNIPYGVDEAEIRKLFSSVGLVDEFRFIRERGKKEHKGCGFCDFFDPCTAEAAVQLLHGTDFRGRCLRVTQSDRALG